MKTIRSFGIGLAIGACALAADLPKGEVVLDKFVEATGGKAAYAKIHNDVVTGSMELTSMGLKGKMMIFAAEPDKQSVEIMFDGIGKIQEASNGEVAWSLSAVQGPRIKEGDEKAEALMRARFNEAAIWRDLYKSAETVAVETVEGKECYKVVLTPKVGGSITRWYDKQTNLLVKGVATAKTPMGDIEAETIVSDYRKEGDLLVPHKVVQHAGPMDMVLTMDTVQHNTEIPKDKFDVPDEIKALMKKPEAK